MKMQYVLTGDKERTFSDKRAALAALEEKERNRLFMGFRKTAHYLARVRGGRTIGYIEAVPDMEGAGCKFKYT